MKLLILGGGTCQLNAVKRAKELGYTVGVADYHLSSPGKEAADFAVRASTFDEQACLLAAREHQIDGIMTLGTDQPVLTCAKVAHAMGLPTLLSVTKAKAVTDKKIMKEIFVKHGLATSAYAVLDAHFKDEELSHLTPPFVIKPLDSQGQRGVYRLASVAEIRRDMQEVLSFSRQAEFLVEEYYPSEEVTVSGWVEEGKAEILTITDRGTFQKDKHIGICSYHRFPSVHSPKWDADIRRLAMAITEAFDIQNGPIYYQLLIGQQGLRVNEVAARIGGAYEDIFIPDVTSVPILDLLIDRSLGQKALPAPFSLYHPKKNPSFVTVHMIFLNPGVISELTPIEDILALKGVLSAGYNIRPGQEMKEIDSAAQRAAYIIIKGKSKKEHEENAAEVFSRLKILDEKGRNMIIAFRW